MGKQRSRKIKPGRSEAERIIAAIVPDGDAARVGLVLADVANQTDADQRHMVRSEQTRTVRRLTRIERMARAGMIEKHHVAACEWYAAAHALGYDTLGITARYGEGTGGGNGGHTHMARYKAQREAREDYHFAREALPAPCLDIFESVVLNGNPVTHGHSGREAINRRLRFVVCADVLHGRIAHMLPVER